MSVFNSLTHSDQFIPGIMQITRNISYQNSWPVWRFSTSLSDPGGVTVSGRLQSWIDEDGSAGGLKKRSLLGSTWARGWWRTNDDCVEVLEKWVCPMRSGDSIAALYLQFDPTVETQFGSSICVNGNWNANNVVPCPVVGKVTALGRNETTDSLDLASNSLITGPLIEWSGGWFIRFTDGTPSTLRFRQMQFSANDDLVIALPYPVGAGVVVTAESADWCLLSWYPKCAYNLTLAASVGEVAASVGDKYFVDSQGTVYFRLIRFTGGLIPKTLPWTVPGGPDKTFSYDGLALPLMDYGGPNNWPFRYTVRALNCAGSRCAPMPNVGVPPGISPTPAPLVSKSPTSAAPTTRRPTTMSPSSASPTTGKPTSAKPTTASPTKKPTSKSPTRVPTKRPSTRSPTTKPTTKTPTKRPTLASSSG